MDDGYTSLARALDFTLTSQLKRHHHRHHRGSTQSQETIPNVTTTSPSTSPRPSEENYASSPSPNVCVRRSHSIGAVADAVVTLPSPSPIKNGSYKNSICTTTASNASSGSARNSFSIGQGGDSSCQSSPSNSNAALSDIDFETTGGGVVATSSSARTSTVSCLSSPAAARRLLGPAMPSTIATLGRHSRPFASATGSPRRLSLCDISTKQMAEQITYLEAQKYSRLTVSAI